VVWEVAAPVGWEAVVAESAAWEAVVAAAWEAAAEPESAVGEVGAGWAAWEAAAPVAWEVAVETPAFATERCLSKSLCRPKRCRPKRCRPKRRRRPNSALPRSYSHCAEIVTDPSWYLMLPPVNPLGAGASIVSSRPSFPTTFALKGSPLPDGGVTVMCIPGGKQ